MNLPPSPWFLDMRGSLPRRHVRSSRRFRTPRTPSAFTLEDRTLLSVGPSIVLPDINPATTVITLAPDGSGSLSGNLLTPADSDDYQFTAPVTGSMNVSLSPASSTAKLNAYLYDDTPRLSYAGSGTFLNLQVVAGDQL